MLSPSRAGIMALGLLVGCQASPQSPPPLSQAKGDAFDLAISNVKIFDSEKGRVLPNMTVLVQGDKIEAVIDGSSDVNATREIKGAGRLLTPGFIDTHAHLLLIYGNGGFGPKALKAEDRELLGRTYLSYGTTTIADMGQPEGWMKTMLEWQESPAPDIPNLVVVGGSLISKLDWDTRPPQHHTQLASPELARQKVVDYHNMGAQNLKLYWKLERPEMEAIITEAKSRDITLFAHIDNGFMTIPDTMDLGVKNFEHFFTLTTSIMTIKDSWEDISKTYDLKRSRNLDEYAAYLCFYFDYIDKNPELKEKLTTLLARLGAEDASMSTTLNMLASAAGRSRTFSGFEPVPARSAPSLSLKGPQLEALDKAYDTTMAYVRMAHDKGISLRIGTDARNGGAVLLEELILLSEAGFSTAEVLQIATYKGAKALNKGDSLGQIAPGMQADFVLFEADPFEDIHHVQGEKTVIKGGQVFVAQASFADAMSYAFKNMDESASQEWLSENIKSPDYGPVHLNEVSGVAFDVLSQGRVEETKHILKLIPELHQPISSGYAYLDEDGINRIGYGLVTKGDLDTAIEVFKLNVELYPASWNVYDSLGETYLAKGEKALGIANYKRSIELNPENVNGVKVLKGLGVSLDASE